MTGEFKITNLLSLDLRGGYANSQREAPYEREFSYVRTNRDLSIDPVGDRFVNALNRQRGDASITRSEEHTSELQSLMRISYAVFCLKKKKDTKINTHKTKLLTNIQHIITYTRTT